MELDTELDPSTYSGLKGEVPFKPDETNAIKSTRKTALQQATDVIYGDREKTYGDPGKNLRCIADYWSNHLSATYGQKIRLTTDDVCVMMILLKCARQANTPGHIDSIVDTIGYAALQDRINSAVASAVPTKT